MAVGRLTPMTGAERDVWTVPVFAPYQTCIECYALVLSVHVDRHYEAAHPGVRS